MLQHSDEKELNPHFEAARPAFGQVGFEVIGSHYFKLQSRWRETSEAGASNISTFKDTEDFVCRMSFYIQNLAWLCIRRNEESVKKNRSDMWQLNISFTKMEKNLKS